MKQDRMIFNHPEIISGYYNDKEELQMRKLKTMTVLAISLLFYPQPGFTQQPQRADEELEALRKEIEALKDWQAMRREIEALKQGQAAIQKELQEIKNLLRARPTGQPAAPRDIVLDIDGEPVKGDKNAKLVLVEFSDYQ